jgi:hypothetical protein
MGQPSFFENFGAFIFIFIFWLWAPRISTSHSVHWHPPPDPEQFPRQIRRRLDNFLHILSESKIRVCAEGLDDQVPQPTVWVNSRFIRLLAGFWELWAAEVERDLERELAACKRLETCYAVSAKEKLVEVNWDEVW